MKPCSLLVLLSLALTAVACGGAPSGDDAVASTGDAITVKSSFVARGTAYYPSNSGIEGGFKDRKGVALKTLQQYLAGNASYVSVAMDTKAFAYGQRLRIKELETKYGQSIIFRVVDTGGAFKGKGRSRIDICVQNASASRDSTINGTLHIDVIDETKAAPPSNDGANDQGSGATDNGSTTDPTTNDPTTNDPAPAPAPAPSSSSGSSGSSGSSSGGGGVACASDGQCNPGNDGSGLICVAGQCVPGCKTDAQCPGSTFCNAGQCE
jgi:3D (Asp-Asp-Asp) domain-containing protein